MDEFVGIFRNNKVKTIRTVQYATSVLVVYDKIEIQNVFELTQQLGSDITQKINMKKGYHMHFTIRIING